ncbi:MAG: peptidoglycan-binding domain-containing protein [Yoonia sp.]
MRLLTLIAAMTAFAMPANADDAAILMGVDRYDDLRRVSGGTDLLGAADPLRDAGYAVSTLANGNSRDMKRLMASFADDAGPEDRLVVGLSGRFATDGTRTWYLAENTSTPAAFGLDDAISVDTVMHVLEQAPGQAILVLGYQQSNFAGFGRYLREGVGTLDVPQGVTVIYGDPDDVDAVLSDAIAAPGANVIGFVRNNRGLNSLGYQPRTLVMQPEGAVAAPELGAPVIVTESSLSAWTTAQGLNTADSYRAFLEDFPDSRYAAIARSRLESIENDPAVIAEREEDALNLTRNERRAIQQDLTLLDFNTRGVDGIFGPGSRSAIRNWQQDNGFAQTSFLNRSQINRLDAQASRREAEIAAEEERQRQEAERLEIEYWQETGALGDEAGFRAYLERYPNGQFAQQAQEGLAAFAPEPAPEPEPEVRDDSQARAREDALNMNAALRRLIEGRLRGLGYDVGNVDGRFNNRTREGIAEYQGDRNLTATGYMDQPTLARLLADTFGR